MTVTGKSFPHILLLSWEFPPPLVGGSMIYMYELARHLPQGSITVLANSTYDPQAEAAFDQVQPFRIIRTGYPYSSLKPIGKRRKLGLLLRWMRILEQTLRQHPTDVLLIVTVFPLGILGVLMRLFRGKPYLILSHGEELSVQLRARGPWIWIRSAAYRLSFRLAQGGIVISGFTAQHTQRFGLPPARTFKIIPPYTGDRFHADPAFIEQVRDYYSLVGKRVILCVGRLIERKGQDRLLETMPLVLTDVPDALLVLVGEGPYEPALRQIIADQGLEQCVLMTGQVDAKVLGALYELCEVFAMPNRTLTSDDTEGFGIVFTEASAHGKPVIGGNAGGTSDAIIDGQTGFLVDGNNVAEIAQRMICLLKNPDLAKRLGQAGRERVLTELRPDRAAAELLSFVSKVIAG